MVATVAAILVQDTSHSFNSDVATLARVLKCRWVDLLETSESTVWVYG